MSKFALLIGINYKGTSNELNGCINDVMNMRDVLIKHFGYLAVDPINDITLIIKKS